MPDKQFWEDLYQSGQMGWDIGEVSTPLKSYIDQLENKDTRIFIPGAGNSYEAGYLLEKGFTDITILDIAPTVIKKLKEKFRSSNIQVIEGDFFQHFGQYDLILEQTFFCALDPSLRKDYARHVYDLLKPKGKLAGVLFHYHFDFGPPPYGGNAEEYKKIFTPYFHFKVWEPCYNSIPPRAGTEWFMILEKKDL